MPWYVVTTIQISLAAVLNSIASIKQDKSVVQSFRNLEHKRQQTATSLGVSQIVDKAEAN